MGVRSWVLDAGSMKREDRSEELGVLSSLVSYAEVAAEALKFQRAS